MILKLKVWLLKKLLKDVAGYGVEGDTRLAHINKFEDKLLKAVGAEGSINIKTGLIQYKGGGGGDSKTTQTIDPAILPYITYGLDEAKGLYEGESPSYYPDDTYVPASTQSTNAMQMAEARARAGSPMIGQAQNTISGMQSAINPALSGYKSLQGNNITTGNNEALGGYRGLQGNNITTGTNEALAGYRGLQGGNVNRALAGTEATARGGYLSAGNPYFSSMMASAAKPAVDQFNTAIRDIGSRASAAGRYGSGAMGEMESQASQNLADSLTDKASQLAYSNYGAERGAQENAIARLGDISNNQFNQQLQATQGLGALGESQYGRDMSAQQNTFANQLAATQGLGALNESQFGRQMSAQQNNFANQLAATQGLGSLSEQQASRQMNAAQLAPQMAAADYQDINQLAKVGQTQEAYSKDKLNADISRFEFNENKPYNKLNSYLSAVYGAPTPVNSTTSSSGGGK